MAGGWSKDGAVQDQIDASIEDAISQARRQIRGGSGLSHCEECGGDIPEARRAAIPGVRMCIRCQQHLEQQQSAEELFNRRGSKDSQLR